MPSDIEGGTKMVAPREGDSQRIRFDAAVPMPKKTVRVIGYAQKEGRTILKNDGKYQHIVDIEKRLVDFGNLEETCDLDIRSFHEFFELRERGGLLGNINLRVFFAHLPERNEIVILKTYKKERNDQTPLNLPTFGGRAVGLFVGHWV